MKQISWIKMGDKVIDISKNPTQKRYFNALFNPDLTIRTDYEEFAYYGAFRCAKSFSQQLAMFLLCQSYAKLSGLFVRDTYDQLKDTVIKQFNDDFKGLGQYKYLEQSREARFLNGSVIKFRAFDRDTNILSAEYDAIAACQQEDLPEELFLQFFGRLSGKILPKPILLTEGNPANNYVKRRYKDKTQEELKAKKIFFIEGQTSDNKANIPEGYIERIIDNYPEFWVQRYIYGNWDNIDEMVLSEYRDNDLIDIIDPKQIPATYKRRNGLDWGWNNPSAVLHSYLDYDGNLVFFDEFEQAKTLPEDLAKEANRHGRILTIADHSTKGIKMPDQNHPERTIWTELLKHGASLQPCNKNEYANILLVNMLMKKKRIKITRNCINLIREIKNYKWKKLKLGEQKDLPEEPIQKDNHLIDCMLYIVASLEEMKSLTPDQINFPNTLAGRTQARGDRVKWQNLG